MLRRTLSTLAALALAAGLTACSDDKKDPEPKATDSTTSAEPTPTAPAWEDEYTEKQLKAYEAALQRWESYLDRSEPIYAKGKATPQAEDLFKEYFPDPVWRNEFTLLQSYEQAKVTTVGQAEVFWTRAAAISEDSLSITLEQCVDFAGVQVTQDGEPVAGNKWTTTPHIREVQLSKPEGYGWLIYSQRDPDGKKKRCDPAAY